MWQIILEFLIGGILIIWSIRSTFFGIERLISKELSEKISTKNKKIQIFVVTQYSKYILRLVIAFIAMNLLVDPLISGSATIYVHQPTRFSTVSENLRVKLAPIKYDGKVDWERMSNGRFDKHGIMVKIIMFNIFENRLYVNVYDASIPDEPIVKKIVYVSAYIRQKLWDKHIRF